MNDESPKLRDYRQYISWQLVSLLRSMKVMESLTSAQQKLIESKSDVIAATIREDVTSRDQQIALATQDSLKDVIADWLRYEATVKTVYNIVPFTNGQYVNILDVFEKIGRTREPALKTRENKQ